MLSLSPNISGDRIGLVLVSVYFLLVPGANFFSHRLSQLRTTDIKSDYSINDFIGLIMLFGVLYIGWSISWEFGLVQFLYVMFILLLGPEKERVAVRWYLTHLAYGLIFYSLIYLGLNQYSFSILLSLANIVHAFLVVIIVIPTFYLDKLIVIADESDRSPNKLTLMLVYLFCQVLTFGVYFYLTIELKYTAYFAILIAIPFLFIIWAKSRLEKNEMENLSRMLTTILWVLPICQTLFFLYYFLETTQVLQAIKGGY